MIAPPTQIPFDIDGNPSSAWIEWAVEIARQSKYLGEFTTAARPTNGMRDGDWIIDTTLGYPAWYYDGGWIDSAGSTV